MAKPLRPRRAGEATVTVSTEEKAAKQEPIRKERNTKHDVDDIPANPAYVIIKKGETIPLEAYASFRADVSVSMPCDITDEALDAAKDRVSAMVQGYLEEEINDFFASRGEAVPER